MADRGSGASGGRCLYNEVPTYALARDTAVEANTDRWAWKIQRTPPRSGRAGSVVVHIWDCPLVTEGEREVDLYDALEVLQSTPGATACTECDAALALAPLL